jgi:ribosomal protein S18 acetylase RimI-like enzyme
MQTLPELFFLNPVLTALQTTHAHLSLTHGEALRYHPKVSPFAAIKAPASQALRDLHTLLVPGEKIWLPDISGLDPTVANLSIVQELPCHQMLLPASAALPEPHPTIVSLTCTHADEMVALTDLAFPGFFRPRTCEMGQYFGIRDSKTSGLIAMAGERLTFPGYSEISAICTHPDNRGQGLAAALTWQVVRHQRQRGITSWLHVSASNERAISLYRTLGFEIVRTIPLTQLERSS